MAIESDSPPLTPLPPSQPEPSPSPSPSPMDKPPPLPASSSSTPSCYIPPYRRPGNIGPSTSRNTGRCENTRIPEDITNRQTPFWLTVASIGMLSGVGEMVLSAREGLRKGRKPTPTSNGSGGSYFLHYESGKRQLGVFKPGDEEPGMANNPQGLTFAQLKKGTKVGRGAVRELAVYLLDHPKSGRRTGSNSIETGFSGVPLTIMVGCLDATFSSPNGKQIAKFGSLQKYMKNCGTCGDVGSEVIKHFPVEEVHKIAVLDLRIGNADRHGGNILMNMEDGHYTLIPIDGGYTFPQSFEDSTFKWLDWPQAKEPFSSETLDYIKSLDAEEDIAYLRSYGLEPGELTIRTVHILTSLLKAGADKGLTPYDIGRILCREKYDEESVIEKLTKEAHKMTLPGTGEAGFLQTLSDLLCVELDKVGN